MTLRRVLVLGSGGREHALAWRLARDPEPAEVIVAPGSAGAARAFRRVALDERDPAAVVGAARREGADLVVIGPEAPLAAGVADALAREGVPVFGPGAAAARLESSKAFAKDVLRAAGVPTARAESFTDAGAARAALARFGPPWVVKADGLAAGKGVLVTAARDEAEAFLAACLERGHFGDAGRRVLLEEFLAGEEVSVMAVCDGRAFALLPPARDAKRALAGDRGPNTGGMGAVAPAPGVDAALEATIATGVLAPTLAEMERRDTPFRGLLYAGLVLVDGAPRVLEFNVRFGDPETQAVLPLVEGSLAGLLASAARGRLEPGQVRRGTGAAVAVALVDDGYPEAARGGGRITGLELAERAEGTLVFGAAGEPAADGWRVTGGRSAWIVGLDASVAAARARAYAAIARLGGAGWRCRPDIGGVPGAGGAPGAAAAAAAVGGAAS